MPAERVEVRASESLSTVMLVQVRCIIVSTPAWSNMQAEAEEAEVEEQKTERRGGPERQSAETRERHTHTQEKRQGWGRDSGEEGRKEGRRAQPLVPMKKRVALTRF